ncbi:hypothetical protein CEXT_238201 [Caerostris extrusa]|uniref:Uncharacterized protein n=1 Tax=Caerostris extrusa TaxID=172846 RepID=A0AAV4MWH9_CAEEX|nr:hypothetical protein CEXT_238201 [Caerostris extrusa]
MWMTIAVIVLRNDDSNPMEFNSSRNKVTYSNTRVTSVTYSWLVKYDTSHLKYHAKQSQSAKSIKNDSLPGSSFGEHALWRRSPASNENRKGVERRFMATRELMIDPGSPLFRMVFINKRRDELCKEEMSGYPNWGVRVRERGGL